MYFWIIVVATVILDRVSKMLVQKYMSVGQSIPLIDKVFHLTYVENHGAAFGMLKYKTTFFIAVTVVVLGLVVIFYRKIPSQEHLVRIALALLVGGAIGNLGDRIFYGHVIDYFDFRIWPVFNVADSAICIGVGLLFLYIIQSEKTKDSDSEVKEG